MNSKPVVKKFAELNIGDKFEINSGYSFDGEIGVKIDWYSFLIDSNKQRLPYKSYSWAHNLFRDVLVLPSKFNIDTSNLEELIWLNMNVHYLLIEDKATLLENAIIVALCTAKNMNAVW